MHRAEFAHIICMSISSTANTTVALDMDTFYASDVVRQSAIENLLMDELQDETRVAFFSASESPLNSKSVYEIMEIETGYILSTPEGELDANDLHNGTLLAMMVEQRDGINVIHYFFDDNGNLSGLNDLLMLVTLTNIMEHIPVFHESQFDESVDVSALSNESFDISSRRPPILTGTGRSDNYQNIPVLHNSSEDWKASLVLYLRRTDINAGPTTRWQATSLVVATPIRANAAQLGSITVDISVPARLSLATSWPANTIGSTTVSRGISAGLNQSGVSVGGQGSISVTQPNITLQRTQNLLGGWVSWDYTFRRDTDDARFGGHNHVQQITFGNHTAGDARFTTNVTVRPGGGSSCGVPVSGSTAVVISNRTLTAPDML